MFSTLVLLKHYASKILCSVSIVPAIDGGWANQNADGACLVSYGSWWEMLFNRNKTYATITATAEGTEVSSVEYSTDGGSTWTLGTSLAPVQLRPSTSA